MMLAIQIGEQLTSLVIIAEQDVTDIERRNGLHVE